MGQLYFVRHGQTKWNTEDKVCGSSDIELTDTGHQQAMEAGRKILEWGICADEILYSPLIRAVDTARHISEMTGIPIREEIRLKEQNYGKWEATSPRNSIEFQKEREQFAYCFDGGESTLQLVHRVYSLLDEICKESERKTYILVAHNGVAKAVHSYFCEMTNEEYATYRVKNCEVLRYEFCDK